MRHSRREPDFRAGPRRWDWAIVAKGHFGRELDVLEGPKLELGWILTHTPDARPEPSAPLAGHAPGQGVNGLILLMARGFGLSCWPVFVRRAVNGFQFIFYVENSSMSNQSSSSRYGSAS
ncbi:methylthioribulose-1-phosphate dehydratase [Striga asiatica]|uniref:Methylthioribulose-1-phosphate dehydratase n=1 Tax=Striga asiatica TaxID=4170 RepID=A0A5A7PTK8_STRAF|nr:methylthioribulose-1-phosphate dehydratase [Striga asiatica]